VLPLILQLEVRQEIKRFAKNPWPEWFGISGIVARRPSVARSRR